MKGKKTIRLTESELHRIVKESVYIILEQQSMVNEGWLKNAAIGGLMGAATMFSSQNADAQDFRRGMRNYYGDNQKTAVRNLKKAGMQDIKKGKGRVNYTNREGIPTYYIARPNDLGDSIQALFPNRELERELNKLEREGKFQPDNFKKIENPTRSKNNISLKDMYNIARQNGFGENDFMLYKSYKDDDSKYFYILPNTDDIDSLISSGDNMFTFDDFDIQ